MTFIPAPHLVHACREGHPDVPVAPCVVEVLCQHRDDERLGHVEAHSDQRQDAGKDLHPVPELVDAKVPAAALETNKVTIFFFAIWIWEG